MRRHPQTQEVRVAIRWPHFFLQYIIRKWRRRYEYNSYPPNQLPAICNIKVPGNWPLAWMKYLSRQKQNHKSNVIPHNRKKRVLKLPLWTDSHKFGVKVNCDCLNETDITETTVAWCFCNPVAENRSSWEKWVCSDGGREGSGKTLVLSSLPNGWLKADEAKGILVLHGERVRYNNVSCSMGYFPIRYLEKKLTIRVVK